MLIAEKLADELRKQLQVDCENISQQTQESITKWLLGKETERYETLAPNQLAIARQAIDYRYRILRHRYLGVGPERAYKNLMTRLGSLVMLRNKIKTWVALSRDRQRAVVDVLQEVIQELLQSDRYLQEQIGWIRECTEDSRLRNALLLTSTEEYCMRPIRNQPLLLYRFVNYLRRSQRGGITQVPTGDLVRLVSEEIVPEEADNPLSLLDNQAIAQYQEKLAARRAVKTEFENYLAKNIDSFASEWLKLYLQGRTQEEIARALNKPIKEIYRLREKISYHAIKVFALKVQPEIVSTWLETSLTEHRLGLTPSQWQEYWESLTSEQRRLLDNLTTGKTLEAVAQDLNLKTNQVMGEWSKLYLAAQEKRNA